MANILDYYGAVEKPEDEEDDEARQEALDKTGIFMDDEPDTETLIGLARKSVNLTKEESDILSEYTAFKDVIAARAEPYSTQLTELKKQGFADGVDDKFNILKAEAEKIVSDPLFQNKVKRDLVSQGDYSMAEVYREKGGQLELDKDGKPIKDLFFPRSVPQEQLNSEINKAYSSGLLNAGTARQAFDYSTPSDDLKVNGAGVKVVDVLRSQELGGVILQTLIDKPYLQNSFDKLKEKLAGDQYLKADEDKTVVENILSPIDAVNDLYYESQASKQSKQDVGEVYEWVAFNLNRSGILDSGDSVTIEEIKPIVDKIALNQAYNDGTIRFSELDETNPKKAASNIGVAPDGTVIVHPLLNKTDFEAALVAKKDDLTTEQVKQARATRERMLIERAPETAKLLASQMGDKWIKFQAEVLDSGKSQKDAVELFIEDRDNFNEFKTRAAGVGASVKDSVWGALLSVPALAGNEKAKDYFINYSKKQQERANVANLFGVQFGIEQDIAQGIAPVIVDGLVTLGLSSTTGVGGAAYLAARAGTKMTVKGLMTAALGKGLRETAEMSAEKLLMKESLEGAFKKSVSPEEALGLIKQYNTAINSSWVKSPAYFLPTANRVAGMGYSNTYATLSEMKKPDGTPMYTPEEVRKAALSSGLITAGASGIISSTFSVLGKMGGVEELFMAGANKKQMLSAINQFADTSGITTKINGRLTEKTFKEVTAKRLKETIKENGLNGIASQSRLMAGVAGGVKMGVEEFPEEMLDQFVSGIIETSFTGEDKPLFDRMAEALHAGVVGLAIGGGLGAVKSTSNQFSKGSQRATQLAQRQIETDYVSKVTGDLRKSGSPITADIVDAIMRKSSGRTGIRVGDKTVSAGDLLAATLNQPAGPTPSPVAPTAAAAAPAAAATPAAATPTPAAAATPTPAAAATPTPAAAATPTPAAAATPTPAAAATPTPAAAAAPAAATPTPAAAATPAAATPTPAAAATPTPAPGRQTRRKAATKPEATVEQAQQIIEAIAEHPENFASKVVSTGTNDIPQAKTFNNQKLNQKKVAAAVQQGQTTPPKPKGGKAAKPRENVVKRAGADEKAVAERIAETPPKPPRKVTKQQVKQETESPSDNSNTNTVVDEDEVVDAADAAVEVEITQDTLNDLQILWDDVNSIIGNSRGSELDPDDIGDILNISDDINKIFPGIPEDIASIPTTPKELFNWVVAFDIWLGQQKTQVEVAAAPAAAAPTKVAPTKVAPPKVAPTKVAPTKVAPAAAAPTKVAPKKKREKTPQPGDVVDESGKVVEPTLDEQIGDFLVENSLVSKEEDFDASKAAIKEVVLAGYPVTFSRNSQYGLQGFSFVGDNSKKLTSFAHELIDQRYPKRPLPDDLTGFTTKVLKDGKNKRIVYFQGDIPFFDNDPVTVRLLIAAGHTVVIPQMFWGVLNNAIKRGTYSGVAHAIKVIRLKTSGTESDVVATTLKTVPVGLAHYDSKTAEYWRGVFDLFWTKESSNESIESEISEERVKLFYTGMVDSTSIETYLSKSIAYVQGKRMPNASNFLVVDGDPRLFTQAQNEILQEAHGRAAQALVRSKLKNSVTKKDNKWVINNGAVTTFKKFLTSIGKNPNEVADRLRTLLNETSPKNDKIFEKYISSLFKGLNSAGLTDTDSIDKISDRVIRRTLQFIDTKKIREAASLSTSLDNFYSFGDAPVDTLGEGGDLTRMSFEDYYTERREFTAGGPLPGEEDVFDEILNFSPIFVESGTLGLGVQPIEEPNYLRLNMPTGGPTQPVDYGRGRVYAVSGIVDGSPAAGALNFGDIIVEIDGTPTANIYAYDIPDKLTFGTPGADVKLQVIRFDSETNSFAPGAIPVILTRATQSAVSKENTPQGTNDYSNLGYKEINGVLEGISNVVRKTVDTFPDLKTGLIDVYRAFAQTDETYEQLRDRTADEILGASMNIYSAIGSDRTISDYLLYSDENPVTDEALRAAAFLKSLRGPDESLPKHLLLFRNYLRVMYNFQSKYADAPLTDYEQALLIKPVKELFAEEGMQLNEDNFNSIVKVLSNRLGNVFGARMQERLAKNFARTKEQRDAAEARNTEEANDLGLANGDPESVITALNRIVADNDYPLYLRTTARALLRSPDLIRNTKLNIFSNNFDFAGKFGTDVNGNYVVSLNLRGSNGKSLASVLTHEYLHALTHNALNDPRFANNAKVTELKRTYEELKTLIDEKGLDDPELLAGMESVDEFVAYMFTSQSFQNAIKRVGFGESKGFFKRILDTILDIFGIRAALRQSEIYTQMVDLVYYAPNTEPLTMGRLNSDLAQSVAEAAAEAAENATALGNMTRPGTVIPAPNAQATPVVAGDPNMVQDPRDTERQRELARTMVARIRSLGSVPAEVPVVVNYGLPQAMGIDVETGNLIINPDKIASDFVGITQDDAEVDVALEIALDEELTHVADVSTIPQGEFNQFANTIADSELEETGVKYYNDPTYTLPDPAVDSDRYLTERNLLVSERLRQNVQGILLGQSTEDMFLFLSRNKANKAVSMFAEAYFKRVVAGYTMKRNLRKFSPRERALLTRLINERRRLALNYRSPNPHLTAGLTGEDLVNQVEAFIAQHNSKIAPAPPEDDKPAEDPTKFDQQNNRFTVQDATFVSPTDNTKLSGEFRSSFNLPLVTDKVKEMGNLLSNGRNDEAYAMAETAVAHMLSDIPAAKYTFKVQRIRGAWADQSQPSLSMTFGTDSEETLTAIRNRMNALGLAFNQDEIHELEVLDTLPEGADYEIGVIDSDGAQIQPMVRVKLKQAVPGAAIETYRRTSGVRGMSYDEGKKEIVLYNLDDDPELFVQNIKAIVTSIRNDFPAAKPTYSASNVRIRRSGNATDEGRGIFAYEDNYVPDSNAYGRDSADEFFAARNAFVRSILTTTGGRLTSPINGPQTAAYKKTAITVENISLLYDTATEFDKIPLDDSANPTVLKAYEALVKDLDRAYKSIVNKKLKIQLTDGKPYGSKDELMSDLTTGVLKIQRTNPDSFTTPDIAKKHPLLRATNYTGKLVGEDGAETVEATLLGNDLLRALHTFATYGVSGPVSQEGSFQFMAAMMRQPEAVWALSGEIRGQHAWHTYGPDARGANGDLLRPNEAGYVRGPDRRWSEQKLALLPIKDALTGNAVIDAKIRKLAKDLESAAPAPTVLPAPSASRFGAISGIPNAVSADTTDYSGFTELFTMTAFEVGTYKSPSSTLGKVFYGSYDTRIKRLLNIQKSIERAGLDMMTRFKTRIDLIVKQEFDGDPSQVVDIMNRASGTTQTTFSNDAWNAINDKYDKQIEEIGTPARPYDQVEYDDMITALTVSNPTAQAAVIDKMARRELYSLESDRIEATRTAEINAERKKINDAVRLDRDAAFIELRNISPKLAKAVADLRQIIDEISRKASKETGIKNPALSVIIEDNLGIYVTRAYQFFEDAGYADIVMSPDAQASSAIDPVVIDAADDYFHNEFLKQEVKRLQKNDLTLTKSQAEAEAEYRYRTSERKHGMSPAVAARIEFLSRYRPGGASDRMAVNQDVVDVVDASLKNRKDIPQVLRNLLGERTGDDGIYNLIRTLGVVTRVTSSQAMVNTIHNIATTGPNKWVYGPDEVGSGAGQILPGTLLAKGYRSITNKLGSSPFSALQGYYAPKEFVEAMEESASEASRRFAAAAPERTIEMMLGWGKYLTGVTMGLKTLWSIAHFPRNVMGQSIMAIHQGRPHLIFTSLAPLGKELKRVGARAIMTDIDDEAFARRIKLVGIGVLGDNVRTNTFRQLVAGQRTIDDIQGEMRMLFDQSSLDKIKATVAWLPNRLAELEGATEDFMKWAVFEDTLSVLTKARDSGEGSFNGVEFSKMTDNDLERLAADMTQETMPAYSRTTPLVKAFTKSNAGDLVAPYIRYYSEMIRVGVRSPILAFQEMRSGNPVMQKRGFQRMVGSFVAHTISVFAAEAITSWFSDIDDEEEETVRAGLAPYLENQSLAFYINKGVLYYQNISFLNPLSVWGDPFKAAYNKMIKGDFFGGVSAALETSLEDTILNPQILFGAVKNALENRDAMTGEPLYIEGVDSDREAVYKQVRYVVEKISPTIAITLYRAYQAQTAIGGVEEEYSAASIFKQQVLPARPTPVDMERVTRNIMLNGKDQLRQVASAQYRITTRKPKSDEYTIETYTNTVEDTRGILSRLYKHGVALSSLGVPNEILYDTISDAIGKGKTDLLYSGVMAAPEIPEGVRESLLRGDRVGVYGPRRLSFLEGAKSRTPAFLSIK
jgi:hypothetical protein